MSGTEDMNDTACLYAFLHGLSHGFKIVVSRPKSHTWHLNTQLNDPALDYYKQVYKYYTDMQENVKEARADLKRCAEKLDKAHPDSESIKYGFRIALVHP